MAKSAKRSIGDTGEDIACKYLISKGFSVEGRNYSKPWGEIDIIAKKDRILVFVEVKSVSREKALWFSRETIRPEENMHERKIVRLNRAIQTYLASKKIPETQNWRIDLLCVYIDFELKKARVESFESVS